MAVEQVDADEPGSRTGRLVAHPLGAMLVGVLVYIAALACGIILGSGVSLGRPATAIVQTLINVAILFLAYKLLIRHLGSRHHDDLSARCALPGTVTGVAAGTLLFTLIVVVSALFGVYAVTGRNPRPEMLLPLFVTAIGPGFMEELLFRGILFRWIEDWGGSLVALVVTSGLFGAAHILNPGATWFSSLAIAVEAGVLLGGSYMLTRSLWMPIGLHASWNFTQGALFGVPVSGIPATGLLRGQLSGPQILSGGRFGLEASLIAVLIATAAGLAFLYVAICRGKVVRPSWVRCEKAG